MFQPLSKEQARAEITRLVENFRHQLPDYKRGKYNETEVRVHYINPFFKALGWDVNNDNGASSAYCEVVHEAKVRVGKATKAPDYLFKMPGGQNLFFVEAKKPSVDIKGDVQPAYQVRRYGWNAKMALSILTDFEELAVYDCTVQPTLTDKSSKARLEYFTFDQYLAEFDFLWDNFSKESVLRGNLDRFVAASSTRRGRETVDRAFLDTLEHMRAALAQGLAARNRQLDAEQLRFLVQMLLDRIIFLRIAEDRGVEPEDDLKKLAAIKAKDGVYLSLLDRFRAAAARYNSGLFDLEKDTLSAEVRLDNATLKPLLDGLYYPESPYLFSVIGAEILGSAYERFLGNIIQLQPDGTVLIEKKPEVRKAGGVFYTPAYIVEYIVRNTVGKLCEGSSPQQVARLRIVDPACGSGSFLLGAYQFLLDWHLHYYQTHPTAALPPTLAPASPKKAGKPARPTGSGKALTPDGRLTTAVKKAILLNNLYGVDLDEQAVEVTKLSLLLKCLEGETSASLQQSLGLERVLPTIDQNIRVGNSLVDVDFYDGEFDFAPGTERTVKPFSWRDEFAEVFQQGGFDAVIGNPPYVRPHNIDDFIKSYLWSRYDVFERKADLYTCFFEKGVHILKEAGILGYIIGNGWLRLDSFTALRTFLLNKTKIEELIDFTNYVFDEAAVKTNTVIIKKENQSNNSKIKSAILDSSIIRTNKEIPFTLIHKKAFVNSFQNIFDLSITPESAAVKETIEKESIRLGTQYQINFGLKTGDDSIFVTKKPTTPQHKRLLRGADIHRYRLDFADEYVWYTPATMRQHRTTARPGTAERFEQNKILVRDTGGGLETTYDEENYYVKDVLIISMIDIKCDSIWSLKSLTGLLNSKLLRYYYETSFPTLHVQSGELAFLPIPALNLKTPTDRQHHDTVVSFVEQLLTLHPQLRAARLATEQSQLQARIRRLDQRLDHLVYLLYGLSYAEAQVVEPELAQRLTEAQYNVWPLK